MQKKNRERIYKEYVKLHTGQKIGDMEPYQKSIQDFDWRLRAVLPQDKDAACLDLACGSGKFLYYLKKKGYRNVSGVDVSPEQVELARQVCVDVYQGNIMEYLEVDHRYDLITMFSLIEHLTPDEAVALLDDVYSALRPGGIFIVITPNADSPFASHMRYGDVTHEVIYTKGALSSLMRASGFINCRALETGPVPHGLISGMRWLIWRLITAILGFYRLVEGGSSRGWIFTTEFITVAEKH